MPEVPSPQFQVLYQELLGYVGEIMNELRETWTALDQIAGEVADNKLAVRLSELGSRLGDIHYAHTVYREHVVAKILSPEQPEQQQ